MYETHGKRVQTYVSSEGAHAFARVGLFVLLTIRNPLFKVPSYMRDPDRHLWGFKASGATYLAQHSLRVYARALAARNRDTLVLTLTDIPGLGIVKAGFMAQLAFGVSGCIDTHNLKRFGLDASQFNIRSTLSDEYKMRRIRRYHSTIDRCGGTAKLWNSWCHWIADRSAYRKRYRDAEHVSEIHAEAIGC